MIHLSPDPALDLFFERTVDVTPDLVFKAWTTPELIVQWFTPRPWQTTEAEIDLIPGGIFRTAMRGPNGEEFSGTGCILEVVENRRFAWTNAMGPGFRPHPPSKEDSEGSFTLSAFITLEAAGTKTKYSALVIHSDVEGKNRHEAMGFYNGWTTALDQLIELMQVGGRA